MNTLRFFLALALSLAVASPAAPTKALSLLRSTPEAQGVAPAQLLAFIEALDHVDGMHSFMLLRHGKVISEGWWAPYGPETPHELYSLSKSFTSTAVGLAVAEGRLSIDDEVLKFFPDEAPANPGANLKGMRVRDLLTMSTGNQDEVPSAPDKISPRAFLTNAVPHKPGTHFKYNTPATFMCSAIIQKLTGQTVAEYLQPRLFEPLGIARPVWNTNFQGVSLGGYGLSLRTEDIAKLGQLYLQKGKWRGRQLIPQDWVELASAKQVSNGSNPKSDWDQGYGFQFWRCRHGAYRGDGAFGQYCLVLPEQDAVIAITSGVKDMQGVLNLIWEKLLPAFGPRPLMSFGTSSALQQKLARLTVAPAPGAENSPIMAKVLGRKFVFPTNEQRIESLIIGPAAGGKGTVLTVQVDGVTQSFAVSPGEWKKGPGLLGNRGLGTLGFYAHASASATGAWPAEDTLVVKQCFIETPYHVTHQFRFDGNQVLYDAGRNVGFGPPGQARLVGKFE